MPFDFEKIKPFGWDQGEELSDQGANILVPLNSIGTVITSLKIPPGQKYFLTLLSLRVVDVGGIQSITFGLKRNGLKVGAFSKIPGTQVENIPTVDVNTMFDPGLLEIFVDNSDAALDIICQGAIIGFTVRLGLARSRFLTVR